MKQLIKKYQDKGLVFADQAMVSGVNFLVGIALTRWLGIEAYGLFSLAWMVVLFVSGIQQSFIIAPLYALTAKQNNKEGWLASISMSQLLFSLICIPLSIIIVEFAFYAHPEWKVQGLSLIIGLLVGVYTLNDFFRRQLFTRQKNLEVLFLDCIGFGLQIIFLAILNHAHQLSLSSALQSILAAQFLSLMVYIIRFKPLFSFNSLKDTFVALWVYSRYLLATSILQWSSGNYFIIVSATLLGPTAVGIVKIIQNLMGLLHIIFLALENLVPLKAASILNSGGENALFHYLKKTFVLLLIPILALISILQVFHEEIIGLVYGKVSEEVGGLLIAFSIIYLMVYLGTFFRFAIRTLEKNQLIFRSYLLTTAFSLILAKPIVSYWGVAGVIIGLAATQLISILYFFFALKNSFKWNISFTWS